MVICEASSLPYLISRGDEVKVAVKGRQGGVTARREEQKMHSSDPIVREDKLCPEKMAEQEERGTEAALK